MYTLNTQLSYFKYNLDFKRLIVNIKWFKLDKFSDLSIQGFSFNKAELDQFKSFIFKNPMNFPGYQFVEDTKSERFDILTINELSNTSLPLYLILSKKSILNLDNHVYFAMMIKLTDEDYEFTVDYTLDFDIVGRIEIYKEFKIK
jgi:hypothetical protein